MSFAKKAVKKTFKAVKKVVKKIWKPVLIAAAIVLTAGVATIGFAGMATAISTQGFLAGMGTTMLAGGQAMLGAVSIGSGVSASVASAAGNASLAGANLFSGALATGIKSGIAKIGIGQAAATQGVAGTTAGTAAAAQSTVSGIAGAQSALASGGLTGAISGSSVAQAGTALANAGFASSTAATSAATGGFFSKVGSVLGSMTQTNSGRMMLFNGISQGVQQFSESKKEKKERARQRKLNFFGGPAVGGSSILPDNMFFPGFGFETDSSSGFTNDFTTDPGQNIEQFGGFDPRSGTNDPILFENIFDDDFTNSFIA